MYRDVGILTWLDNLIIYSRGFLHLSSSIYNVWLFNSQETRTRFLYSSYCKGGIKLHFKTWKKFHVLLGLHTINLISNLNKIEKHRKNIVHFKYFERDYFLLLLGNPPNPPKPVLFKSFFLNSKAYNLLTIMLFTTEFVCTKGFFIDMILLNAQWKS